MKQTLVNLAGAAVLLVAAFLPPVVAAAGENANVHFGEHIVILLAGLLLAYAGQTLIRRQLAQDPRRATRGIGIIGLGIVLFLASQVPALDALADSTMAMHVLQHLMILAAGGFVGMGLVVFGAVPAPSPR